MKINNLTNGIAAALLLASPLVGAETQYPASDFKPKIIYQDIDSSSAKAAPTSTKQSKVADADSKYPATDFEPKVVYKDADYKASKNTASSAPASSKSESVATSVAVAVTEPAKEESMLSFLLGLGVFGVAGYLFLAKREKPKAKAANAETYTSHVSGLSGVARYLRKHNMSAATGVARYLESIKSSEPVSGVDKYLEKQEKSAKQKAALGGTGVEKYLRRK